MDLSSIVNLFSQRPQIVRTPEGTYGPAESLYSHTPINFTTSQKIPGQYDPNTKSITVNPTAGADVSNVIRHESIHAILDALPNGSRDLTQRALGYAQIAQMLHAGGDPANEVPAYMGASPQSQILGVSDPQRNTYMQSLVEQLNKLDPSIAKKLAKFQ